MSMDFKIFGGLRDFFLYYSNFSEKVPQKKLGFLRKETKIGSEAFGLEKISRKRFTSPKKSTTIKTKFSVA